MSKKRLGRGKREPGRDPAEPLESLDTDSGQPESDREEVQPASVPAQEAAHDLDAEPEQLPRRAPMPVKPLKPLKPLNPRASSTKLPHQSRPPGINAVPGRLQKALFNYLGFFVHLIACFPFTLILGFVGGAIIGLAGLKAGTLLSCTILAFLFGTMSMLYGFLSVKLVAFLFRSNAVVVRQVTAGSIGFWLLASTLYIFSIPKAPAESVAVLVGCLCNALSQYLTMQKLTRQKSALHPPAA